MRWLLILQSRKLKWTGEPMAALISLDMLRNALNVLGYPAVALFIMIESSGIPFPGETMLLLASFYSGVDQQLQIPVVITCAALGAILGDNAGYFIGRTGGRAFVQRFGRYLFLKPRHLERAEKFFARHGNKTVFFGRFVSILRTWSAFLAGVNHMHWRSFLFYNAAGGIVWAIVYGLLGYYAGHYFKDNFAQVDTIARTVGWAGATAIVLVILLAIIIYHLRRRRIRSTQSSEETRDNSIEQHTEETASPVPEP